MSYKTLNFYFPSFISLQFDKDGNPLNINAQCISSTTDCQKVEATKSPEEAAIPYVLIAVISAVVLSIIVFIGCAIYCKKKKRTENVKPLLVRT